MISENYDKGNHLVFATFIRQKSKTKNKKYWADLGLMGIQSHEVLINPTISFHGNFVT
jgi:hypothetical protein